MTIDVIDHKILKHLKQNARLSNQELAELVNLSASACHRRVKILEKSGVIEGYQAKINYEKLGMNFFAIVEIKLSQLTETDHLHMLEQINMFEEVINAYIVTGESNYILYIMTEDLNSFSNFVINKLNKVKGIMSINSKIILDKVIQK
ncbi:Lrp/AsnC family transcriptional regulator GigD [Psychrobacter lutiphocae]|uniref:Lrp/AsnC family transcriptional regulator GigD n=1 Tax=Psychrobacter lutiphocae TaxID=540500 RepID=UPI00036C9C54|nr:Lrp/AsnC family transcriptional regulator GigD [Psychrobacter lutiphocae]